jgi:hypothetical protein
MNDNLPPKDRRLGGITGEWFLWIVAVFAVVALIASWAGGYWDDVPPGEEVPAPVATPID